MAIRRVQIACGRCGSTDVRRDAYAAWNEERQQWELAAVFDHATCEGCGHDTTLIEKVPLKRRGA